MTNDTDFEIETDVPCPTVFGRPRIYPFPYMNVGDSFRVSDERAILCRYAASQFGKRNNKKFAVRKREHGFRCWRVE